MPRIRTIKPEFWQNPQVCRCSYPARLLFIGTWHYADDHGNLPRDAEKLRMQVFPSPHDAALDIEALVLSLIAQGLLMEYSSEDEQRYLHIPTFVRHQVINRPSKTAYPQPDKKLTEQYVRDVNAKLDKAERESRARPEKSAAVVSSATLTEGSSMERKGKERSKPKSGMSLRTYVEQPLDLANGSGDPVVKIFDYWRERMKSPRSVLSDRRRRNIAAALKLHSPADLCRAIRGCSRDPWHMGMNDSGRPFNSIELILRDEKHIEQFIAYDTNPPQPVRNGGPISRQDRRRKTAEAFGFVADTRDDSTIDLPPEDAHVVDTKH